MTISQHAIRQLSIVKLDPEVLLHTSVNKDPEYDDILPSDIMHASVLNSNYVEANVSSNFDLINQEEAWNLARNSKKGKGKEMKTKLEENKKINPFKILNDIDETRDEKPIDLNAKISKSTKKDTNVKCSINCDASTMPICNVNKMLKETL